MEPALYRLLIMFKVFNHSKTRIQFQQQTGLSEVDLTQAEIQEAVNSGNNLAEQHRQSECSLSEA